MVLIGLVGRARSGKDTFANELKAKLPCVFTLACADPLKKACAELYGIPLNHFYDDDLKEIPHEKYKKSPRQMCKDLGTEYLRHQVDENFLVERMKETVNEYASHPYMSHIIVTDVRFANEASAVFQMGGTIVYINADERLGPLPKDAHESEKQIAQIGAWDGVKDIYNNGTKEEYLDNVQKFIESEQL